MFVYDTQFVTDVDCVTTMSVQVSGKASVLDLSSLALFFDVVSYVQSTLILSCNSLYCVDARR
eukprot:m.249217 g.249217  ORF g.249217 m.249217 type:complete len:63 (+) comp16140_c1_seq10:760-948(+)